MSADNVIYIKKEAEDRFLVWETGFSDEDPRPSQDAKVFPNYRWACQYAEAEAEEHFVEYGIAPYTTVGKSIKEQNEELDRPACDEDPTGC